MSPVCRIFTSGIHFNMLTMKGLPELFAGLILLSLAPYNNASHWWGHSGGQTSGGQTSVQVVSGCAVSELPPTPTNADRTPDISGNTADAGTVVKYVCHTGHEIVGDPVLAAVTPAPITTTTPASVGRELTTLERSIKHPISWSWKS